MAAVAPFGAKNAGSAFPLRFDVRIGPRFGPPVWISLIVSRPRGPSRGRLLGYDR